KRSGTGEDETQRMPPRRAILLADLEHGPVHRRRRRVERRLKGFDPSEEMPGIETGRAYDAGPRGERRPEIALDAAGSEQRDDAQAAIRARELHQPGTMDESADLDTMGQGHDLGSRGGPGGRQQEHYVIQPRPLHGDGGGAPFRGQAERSRRFASVEGET